MTIHSFTIIAVILACAGCAQDQTRPANRSKGAAAAADDVEANNKGAQNNAQVAANTLAPTTSPNPPTPTTGGLPIDDHPLFVHYSQPVSYPTVTSWPGNNSNIVYEFLPGGQGRLSKVSISSLQYINTWANGLVTKTERKVMNSGLATEADEYSYDSEGYIVAISSTSNGQAVSWRPNTTILYENAHRKMTMTVNGISNTVVDVDAKKVTYTIPASPGFIGETQTRTYFMCVINRYPSLPFHGAASLSNYECIGLIRSENSRTGVVQTNTCSQVGQELHCTEGTISRRFIVLVNDSMRFFNPGMKGPLRVETLWTGANDQPEKQTGQEYVELNAQKQIIKSWNVNLFPSYSDMYGALAGGWRPPVIFSPDRFHKHILDSTGKVLRAELQGPPGAIIPFVSP